MLSLRSILPFVTFSLAALQLSNARALPDAAELTITTTIYVNGCSASSAPPVIHAGISTSDPSPPTTTASVSSTRILATLPVNQGPTELPAPLANLSLKYVTLGRGIQNYTCASDSATPVAIGAVALLFDVTALTESSPEIVNTLPEDAVNLTLSDPFSTTTNSFTISGVGSLPLIGHHFFSADGTPVFDLNTVQKILFAKKITGIKAPTSASPGPAGTGAVDWLDLGDKGGSVRLGQVYRVVTAGGNPPKTCQGLGSSISVQYAAQYWFFG